MSESFPYDLDPRFAAVWAPLLLVPGGQGVTLTDDGRFVVRYGLLRIDTPLTNVAGAHVIGPYRWWTSVGVRLSARDDGLTFGTTNHAGACVHFREPIRPVIGPRRHSAVTVTVADPEALVRRLTL